MDKIDELLTRGVDTIYPSKEELEKVLRSGKKIRIYQGFDPTGTQLHIGHAVALMKLRNFQELGHKVIFLIGDFTAMIGDPSGKIKGARKMISREEVLKNAETYETQASRILRFSGKNKVKVKFNSQWLGKMSAIEFLRMSDYLTFAQIIKRDLFRKREQEGQDIYANEFMYPILQGYDSVAMDVDAEIGGTDQMFNMLVGRDLLKRMKKKEKFVITVPLLTDTQGNKIGKSEGNVIGITDTPEDLYGKIMSLPDSAIIPCFELITNLTMTEVEKIKNELKTDSANPMEYKKRLARQIVEQYNNADAATAAQRFFEAKYQEGNKNEAAEEISIKKPMGLVALISKLDDNRSSSDIKRLIKQGGIKINGKKNVDMAYSYEPKDDDIIEIGKHRVFRVKSK